MNKHFFNTILLLISSLLITCTDPIDPDIKEGESQLAVEGLISDQTLLGAALIPDTVRLTVTNGYLNGASPVVPDAVVILKDNLGNGDTLQYVGEGKYITDTSLIKGVTGRHYELTIEHQGEIYKASDYLPRTTTIDSLVGVFRAEPLFGRAPGWFVELYSKDKKGVGDFYRFKVYKNGVLFNRPEDLNLASDASFGPETPLDSVRFVFPIRESLNPRTGDIDPNTGGDKAPYAEGDTVKVEIVSLSYPTYYFYTQVQTQIRNDGLFASPSFNVTSNIQNVNPSSPKKAVGWFHASSIVSKSVIFNKSNN